MRAKVLRVGLVLAHNLAYCRGVLRGIKEFAESRPDWVLMPIAPEPRTIRALGELDPAGLIVHMFAPQVARAALQLDVPTVNVSGAMRRPPVPRVGTDEVACGRLAARHFLDRGFRNFAFVGHKNHFYSVAREASFRSVLELAGFPVEAFHEEHAQPFEPLGRLWSLDTDLHRWLARLPRPVAIFACNDIWGLQLTEACRQQGLKVPEDVAIVGVDNDDLLCGLARPPLSSIISAAEKIGVHAAAMLDRLLARRPPPAEPLLFAPTRVVPRQSSDVLAISDPDVAAAVRFIREEGHRPIRVRDVLAAVPVSRRSLERRFQQALGRSPLDEIRQVHLSHACRLLTESDMPMQQIAARAGFSDAKQLSVMFRQFLDQSPTEYRKATRGGTGRWERTAISRE